MSDDRLEQAVDIVARHAIARWAAGTPIGRLLNELTMKDRQAVFVRIRELTPYPDPEQYAAAYDFLAGRAEGGA